jgi:hypothetical protein
VLPYAFCVSLLLGPISVLAIPPATVIGHGNPSTISGSWVYSNFQSYQVKVKPIFVAYQSTDTEILELLTPTSQHSSSSMIATSPNALKTLTYTFASPTSTVTELLTPTLQHSSSSMITPRPNASTTITSTFASPTSTVAVLSTPAGLSEADKIAIGVVVPLAVLALVAALFLFYRKSQILAPREVENLQLRWEKPELPAHSQPAHPPAHTPSVMAELEGA